MKLFSYQEKFLKVIQESFQEQILEPMARVLMVLATGLGKTIVAAFWAKEELKANPNQKILFLCHENNILNQTYRHFKKIIDGNTVMRKFYGKGKTKDFLADNAQIVFSSFQTMANADWRYGFDRDHFDIIIVDESHHSQAETYKEVIEYFEVKKRFGMTATPDRMDLKDIRELFGPEVISCDLIEAILNDWLTPFEYHILNDNISTKKLKKILEGVLKKKERVSVKQLNETIFIEKRDQEIVKKISDFNGNFQKKTIIFCENIDHIRVFKESLPEGLEFHSMNNSNEENLQSFRDGKVNTILAVNKFNEGIDVPDVEVIVFLRGTDSNTIFFQQLGRGLRLFLGKERVMILDFVANIDRLLFVNSIIERVKREKGLDVSKRIFKIDGNNFDYVFEDNKLENVLEVIKCILAKTYISDIPHLFEEYSEKNELPASQVLAGTHAKLWWECKTCQHEWQANGYSRSQGTGCPACAKQVVTDKNNLAVTHPHLVLEYSKRNELPADKVIAGTNKKLWWKCSVCEHEWQAGGNYRTTGVGCPACANRITTDKNNLAVKCPHLIKEYLDKNKLPESQVLAGTHTKLWWKCSVCEHEWQATGNSRSQGTGCPACAKQVVTETNNLAATHPFLALKYSEKNELPANKVIAGTRKKLWWKCSVCEHEWQATGDNIVYKHRGCPACANRVVTEKNNLTVTHPHLAEEYSEKNELPADKVIAGTNKKLWWKCSVCGYEWQATGNARLCGWKNCPNRKKHPKK